MALLAPAPFGREPAARRPRARAAPWRSRSCASVKGMRGKPGRDAGVSGATLSRAALTVVYAPRLGREAGAAREAIIDAHGMTPPVSTNGGAPKSERICRPPLQLAGRKERAARARRRWGCSRAPSRRRTMPEVPPPSSIAVSGARPICGMACGPRLLFKADSLPMAAIPVVQRTGSDWGQRRRRVPNFEDK